VVAFTPGVTLSSGRSAGLSASGNRLGGASQDNVMMDGISAMDTGNNGQMLRMNIESIGEVKIVTQGYQAEYGRSSGLQITAVTKNGTNELHGSAYGVLTDSDWDKNSWANTMNGRAKSKTDQQIYGYTIGGPVVIPKAFNGRNKLFSSTRTSSRRANRAAASTKCVCRRWPSAQGTSPRASTTTATQSRR